MAAPRHLDQLAPPHTRVASTRIIAESRTSSRLTPEHVASTASMLGVLGLPGTPRVRVVKLSKWSSNWAYPFVWWTLWDGFQTLPHT